MIKKENYPLDKKILIVDDDFTYTRKLKKFFDNKGYYVKTSDSALLGKEFLNEEKFGLVITDIQMPEVDGFQFFNWIKEKHKKTKVALMTSYGSENLKEYAISQGISFFCDKPLELDKVERQIKKVFNKLKIKIKLSEMLKMLAFSEEMKIIEVINQENFKSGKIYLNGKIVIHSEYDNLIGFNALKELISLKDIETNELDWESPNKTTINQSINNILNGKNTTEIINQKKPLEKVNQKKFDSNKKVIIVDDGIATAKIIAKYLKKRGFYTVAKDSAISAQKLMKEEEFGIVITDINMPEVSGLDFLFWIREFYPKTKVIMMSAFYSDELKQFANESGVIKYLEKPINFIEIENLIQNELSIDKSSNVEKISLFDFLQIITFSEIENVVSVFDLNTNQIGLIFIKEENVVHAEIGNFKGKTAFYKMILSGSNKFYTSEWFEPVEKSINEKLMGLMNPETLMQYTTNLLKLKEKEEIITKEKKGTKKVLIVDDDFRSTKIIKGFFAKNGYYAINTHSAVAGKTILKQELFDIVITDINMPNVNGIEFLLWIKKNSPKTKVILITSYLYEDLKDFANQKSTFEYIEKPLTAEKLKNTLNDNKTVNSEIQLLDYIQLLIVSGVSKVISVTDLLMNHRSLIYIKKGNVIHAEFGSQKGVKAFNEIIKDKNAFFTDVNWQDPKERTIFTEWQELYIDSESIINQNSITMDLNKILE